MSPFTPTVLYDGTCPFCRAQVARLRRLTRDRVAFADAYAALKPGGVLGVEQHRLGPEEDQDPVAANGYVQEAFVRQLAAEAGFVFVAASEVNANDKDTKDHPFGVDTLPPMRLTAPQGQPADPTFDRSKFEAIGESDRMTLKFRKPE